MDCYSGWSREESVLATGVASKQNMGEIIGGEGNRLERILSARDVANNGT
jgi:hypothetical protein